MYICLPPWNDSTWRQEKKFHFVSISLQYLQQKHVPIDLTESLGDF